MKCRSLNYLSNASSDWTMNNFKNAVILMVFFV